MQNEIKECSQTRDFRQVALLASIADVGEKFAFTDVDAANVFGSVLKALGYGIEFERHPSHPVIKVWRAE